MLWCVHYFSTVHWCFSINICVTQWLKTRRFLDIELEAQIGERVSSFQFFNSAGVCEFVINSKVVTQF